MPAVPSLHPAPSPSNGARLYTADGQALPLLSCHLQAEAAGGYARVELAQVFHNVHDRPLEVFYQLPLPADAAVAGFQFELDGETVIGEVQRRKDARETFEAAILEGATAALIEQERSSFFTQRIGNLPPRSEVRITIRLDQPLAWRTWQGHGGYEWRFPTVLGPRYLGADPRPDAERLVVDVAPEGTPTGIDVSLLIRDSLTGTPLSSSHPLAVQDGRVTLAEPSALDRDIVVRWPVTEASPGVQLRLARPSVPLDSEDTAFASLCVVPPVRARERVGRHLVVLLDVSGSMDGAPLRQAKQIVSALIATMDGADFLELLVFSSAVVRLRDAALRMDGQGRIEALRWLERVQCGGVTEMLSGFRAAVAGDPAAPGLQKQVLLVTDGYIGQEADMVAAALKQRERSTRVHAIGVGNAVNRSLLAPVARAGGGVEVIVAPDEDLADAIELLTARTAQPLLVDLELSGSALADEQVLRQDLYAGSPATLLVRVRAEGGQLELRGRSCQESWTRHIEVPPTPSGAGPAHLPTCWARDRVEHLEARSAAGEAAWLAPQIEKLGLDFQLSTRLTSWVARTRTRTVRPDQPPLSVVQPQALPAGVSAMGVGLRPSAGDFDGEEHTGFMCAPSAAERRSGSITYLPSPSPSRRAGPEIVRQRTAMGCWARLLALVAVGMFLTSLLMLVFLLLLWVI